MTFLKQDLAYTFRRLSRSRGFAIAVIVSIGLGIAANATIVIATVTAFVSGLTEIDWCLEELYLTVACKVPTKENIIEEAEVGINELLFRVLSKV